MVLISGNNKSILLQPNDERSKAQGASVLHNSHQQGSKSVDGGRMQNSLSTSLTKGMTTMDEFKYGFPSDGLSTTSNKWWGSSDDDDCAGMNPEGAKAGEHGKSQLEERAGEADKDTCETGNAENTETLQGTALLTAVRKRAVEEGQEAFRLGVVRGYGVNKLGKREKVLLRQIFRSSLPRSWIDDL